MTIPELLSISEAARQLDLSPRRVRALVESGRLRANRVGSRYVISRSDVGRYQRSKAPSGRPISAANAWGLVAILAGEEPSWLGSSAEWRLRRLLKQGAAQVEDALLRSAPRSDVHHWRLLLGDLAKALEDEDVLVLGGLAAQSPSIDVPYLPGQDPLEAYVSDRDLRKLRGRFKPSDDSSHANLLLRVPAHPWVLKKGPAAPEAVVAADLLEHDDERVVRAGRQLLERLVDAHQHS